MSRFVAAILVTKGPLARVQVDPRTRGAEDLGDIQAAAMLARSHYRGRAERKAGEDAIRKAGREAWRIRQQQRGEEPRSCA